MADLMTAEELAEYLKVSKNYIYQLKAEHKLPYKKIGKCVRFSRSDIERWLSEQTNN